MDNKKVELVLKKVGNLPSIPSLVNKIIDVTSSDRSSILDIANAVATDQSFAAKILRLANSAYFGYSGEISTLSQAIVILGTESIKNIAFGISVFSSVESLNDRFRKIITKVWKFSAKVAITSRELAKILRYPYREEAFVSGLLHDIGRVIIIKYLNGRDIQNIVECDDEFRSILDKQYSFEITHSELGAYLADFWNMPDKQVSVMKYHHNPFGMPSDIAVNPEISKIIKIVSIAQFACDWNNLSEEDINIFSRLKKELNISEELIFNIISSHTGEYELLDRNLDLH